MRLDIVIATFNRSTLLAECLESVLRSRSSADWRVTVVDNNSNDDTRRVVETFVARTDRVRYLFEGRQGKSFALNSAIAASECDLIGMIDDDEQVHPNWIETATQWMQKREVDYIGGPYLGLWRADRPNWLPPGYAGVISAADPESIPTAPVRFDFENRVGRLMQGGNAVVRRSVFDRVGFYRTDIGRSGNNLGTCEDVDMFYRCLDAGLIGYYVPDLVIYHVVSPERLKRSYYRKWVFGQSKYAAKLDREQPQKVAYFARMPRYMLGMAVRSLPSLASPNPATRFSAELEWWKVAGFLRGVWS